MAIKAPFANPNLWLGCVWFSVKFELDLENLFETFDYLPKEVVRYLEKTQYLTTYLQFKKMKDFEWALKIVGEISN